MSNESTNGMPNVVAVATATNYGRFAVGPLESGIGTTLGNALRRILLSSLPGSAITSVRIQNVYHEFSCIPSVREDVTEIVVNVKNVRLRSYSERPVRLQLSKQGAGYVRAGDIEIPANVELVNPDLLLATLDGPDAHIEMELTVERGRGYVSFEAREGMAIGTIPVDAIFSPIPRVNYIVEPANADVLATTQEEGEEEQLEPLKLEGKEQLLMEIWTDGTIDPGEALSLSAQYLAQHSSLISNFNRIVAPPPGRELPGSVAIPPHLFEMPIDDLSLSMRTYNCLKRSGVTKVGQVLRMDKKELLGLRNFGDKSFDELHEALQSRNLIPPGSPLDLTANDVIEANSELDDVDAELDIEYPDADDIVDSPEGYMLSPEIGGPGGIEEVVSGGGVSEGSLKESAGIYVDGEPASEEMDFTGQTVPTADFALGSDSADTQEEVEARPKARSKKKA